MLRTKTCTQLIELVKGWGGSVIKNAQKQDLVNEVLRVMKPPIYGCSEPITDSDSMVEAHKWAHKAVNFAYTMAASGTLPHDAALWMEGRITAGTSFSGIGTPEWALKYIEAAGKNMQQGDPLPRFEVRFVLDREPACRKAQQRRPWEMHRI